MTTEIRAYSTRTVSGAPLAVGLACVAVVWAACAAVDGRVWPVLAAASVAILAACVHLAVVRLTVGPRQLFVGFGPWGRVGRGIPLSAVSRAEAVRLSGAQAYGFGMRWWTPKLSRYTVRGGDAVHLSLTSGEQLYVTVRNGAEALGVLGPTPNAGVSDSAPPQVPRPWFGPKRVGFGLRPQTWQGWTLTVALAAVVVAAAALAAA